MTEVNRESRAVVAANLREQRQGMGYSKRQLAKEAGVSEAQLRKWESGRVEPSARNLLKIIAVIGPSLEWFYTDHNQPGRDGA